MYPWLRLIGVGASALKQSRVDLFDPTRITLRVWPDDLDANLHVNNGRYLALADLGRIHWFVRAGVMSRASKRRALPVVADASAKFRRELKLWQPFAVETRLLGWQRRFSFLEHRFVVDGRVAGIVAVRCVFKAGRRTIYPAEIFGGLTAREHSPPLPAWLSLFDDSCESLALALQEEERGPEQAISAAERQRMN